MALKQVLVSTIIINNELSDRRALLYVPSQAQNIACDLLNSSNETDFIGFEILRSSCNRDQRYLVLSDKDHIWRQPSSIT